MTILFKITFTFYFLIHNQTFKVRQQIVQMSLIGFFKQSMNNFIKLKITFCSKIKKDTFYLHVNSKNINKMIYMNMERNKNINLTLA